jgi:hypothetical protein
MEFRRGKLFHQAVSQGSSKKRERVLASHLSNVQEISSRIRFWGPYLSEYGDMTPDGRYLPPLVMIGTGTGCGPLLDFYLHVTANNYELQNSVSVYFSTNSLGLFQFVTDLICAKPIHNYSVNAHLTSADDYEKGLETIYFARKRILIKKIDFEADEIDPNAGGGGSHESTRDMKLGRLSFMDVLSGASKDTEVLLFLLV